MIKWLTIKNLLAIKQVETTEIVVVVTPAAVVVVADDDEALTKPETSLDDLKIVRNLFVERLYKEKSIIENLLKRKLLML